ncbi:MAG: FMN-binding protein [Ruminococcaceae bacterium]|nr:FMN-binding protein [Oscillospiraceae bacterium]
MKYIKCILSLTLICSVIAVMLAFANYITEPIIAKNDDAKANEALLEVMPDGEDFTLIDTSTMGLATTVNEVYTEKNGGVVVKLTTTGFNPNMTVMVGIDANGNVTGATCLSSEETLGYEKTYGESVKGATISTIDSVDTVSGATKTTSAYRNAVRDALNAAIVAGGGEAVKSDEEIFAENLAAALPEADGLAPVFMLDEIEGIDGAYASSNNVGYVICIGDKFIATDNNGKVISDSATTEEKAAATSAVAMISSWETTQIDLAAYANMPSAIVAAYETNSGNYLFDVKAAGYGINGGNKYHPASGEYIYIKVSITADGKIIACETVSQQETAGLGDACASPEYYSQFNGKTAENYKEVDAIGGATLTSNGYVTAISRVFEAITILNGGAINE